jgi:hypothetical protein
MTAADLGLVAVPFAGFCLLFKPEGGAFVARGQTESEAVQRARGLRSRNLVQWERPGPETKQRLRAGPGLFDAQEA